MISTIALALALTLQQAPKAPQQAPIILNPEQEARAFKLGKNLRCAVCQGLSIADSPASMARAQYDTVKSLILEGKSDEEIYQYFIERYGEWALLAPPTSGFNWVVWAGPGGILLLGAFVVFRLLRSGPVAPPTPATGAAPASPSAETTAKAEEEDPYLAAVRAELKRK